MSGDGAVDGATAGGLIERERELEALAAAIAATAAGEGRVVMIEGPAGAGKTALLEAASERAEAAGLAVARARGAELEAGFDFGVALALLAPGVEALRGAGEEPFEGAAGLARPLFGDGRPAAGDDPFPLVHGLHSLIARLAEAQPLALLVDDVQWCDERSLRTLAYAAPRTAGSGVLLVCGRRTGEQAAAKEPLEALIGAVSAEPVRPSALSPAGVASLAGALLGEPPGADLAAAIVEATRGNPLFVRELARAVRDDPAAADSADRIAELGPEPVVALVERRLERLPHAARALAQALAVVGPAPLREASRVAGLSGEEAAAAVDALVAAELLEPELPAGFSHPILRRAAYETVPPGERARVHLRAAELQREAQGAPDRVAQHLLAGMGAPEHPEWAAGALLEAARDARSRGGSTEAARYLRGALDAGLPDGERCQALLELGTIEAQARDPAALEHLGAAAALAGDPATAAGIALVRARALFYFVALEECARVCREAIEGLGDGHRELRLQLQGEALSADVLRGAGPNVSELASEVAAGATPGERAALVHVAVEAVNELCPHGEVRELAERAWAGGLLAAEIGTESPAYSFAGTTLAWAEAYDTAGEMASLAVEDGRERGSLMAISYGLALRSGIALRTGDLAAAEADAELLAGSGLPASDPLAYMITLAFLIETLVERGRPGEARDVLDRSGLTGDLPDLGTVHFLLLARGYLAVALGDADAALAEYREAGLRIERAGYRNPAGMAWRSRAAVVLTERGEHDEAVRLADEELGRCRRFGAPRALGVALIASGRARGGERGEADLRGAVAALAASEARLEHARALIELGAHLRRAGRAAEAREPLSEGMDRANRCGGAALVEQALGELRAAGARPRRPAVSGADALTPQERRVARLAAEGRSNRQIAEALFLGRRTVELHLSNTYRKLEVEGREGLAGALAS